MCRKKGVAALREEFEIAFAAEQAKQEDMDNLVRSLARTPNCDMSPLYVKAVAAFYSDTSVCSHKVLSSGLPQQPRPFY